MEHFIFMQCKLERKSLWIFERCSSGFNVHLTRDLTTRLEGKKTDFAWSITWSVSINSFKFAHYYTRNLPMVIPKTLLETVNLLGILENNIKDSKVTSIDVSYFLRTLNTFRSLM